MDSQMLRAKGSLEVPLKIFINRMLAWVSALSTGRVGKRGADSTNEAPACKPFLPATAHSGATHFLAWLLPARQGERR